MRPAWCGGESKGRGVLVGVFSSLVEEVCAAGRDLDLDAASGFTPAPDATGLEVLAQVRDSGLFHTEHYHRHIHPLYDLM